MDIVTIVVITVVTALLAVLLRQHRPELAMLLVMAAGVVILVLLLTGARQMIDTVTGMLEKSGLPGEYTQILFKGLGICLLTQLASDTCKDAGELAMASKAQLAGQLSLMVVGLPLFEKIASVALSLMNS